MALQYQDRVWVPYGVRVPSDLPERVSQTIRSLAGKSGTIAGFMRYPNQEEQALVLLEETRQVVRIPSHWLELLSIALP
jgi:hypothetical protein